MIFTDLYKSPKSPLSRLRHPHHPIPVLSTGPVAPGPPEFDPDLVSKDKSRQKEAVKRHLQAHVRADWTFTWPQETSQAAPPSRPYDGNREGSNREDQGSIDIASQNSASSHELFEQDETALESGDDANADSDVESVYSIVSDDPLHWRPRLEWASAMSDDELPYNSPTPFTLDSPDSVGHAVTASKTAGKARRRKELRKEIAWNDGLACFEARRNAWTGAKVARLLPKPSSPTSPLSPRLAKFWRTHSRSQSNAGQTMISTGLVSPMTRSQSHLNDATLSSSANLAPSSKSSCIDAQRHHAEPSIVETLLPVPTPLLPPANPMRASITPAIYQSIYEKVVMNGLQPSCPINLSDMVRACVAGWKRDGEWPPRPAAPESATVVAVKRRNNNIPAIVSSNIAHAPAPGRRLSFSFLGGHGRTPEQDSKARRDSGAGAEEGPGPGEAIRRSLQRVLGIGQTMVTAGDGHVAA